MNEIDLSLFTYLLVDDVRLCRFNVLGILKNLGCVKFDCVTNGAEAKSYLEKNNHIDCVITDIDMPVMNGLQLLKSIRVGIPKIRRDLPVALLTGHSDELVVGLGLALDVNTFILKPANKALLNSRLKQIFYNDLTQEQWIRSPDYYEKIDVDAPISELIQRNSVQTDRSSEQGGPVSSDNLCCSLDDVPEGATLTRTAFTKNGRMIYDTDTLLTNQHLTRLKGLRDLGFFVDPLWITPPKSAAELLNRSSEETTKTAVLQKEDANVSTFARFGHLDFGAKVSCMRCSSVFVPDHETIRLHNRHDLSELFCPDCQRRDNELLCASVRLIILKGGFSPTFEQIESAFGSRDSMLERGKEDPFETLRKDYQDDPMTQTDILRWVRNKYLSYDKSTKKLDCMIDRIMENPERVLLLGKEGLLAKRMAVTRSKSMQGIKTK